MYTITDSICLKILATDCLLVAVGNDLHFYQKDGDHTFHKSHVTPLRDKIHGIQSIQKSRAEFDVVVHGGREVAVIRIDGQNLYVVATVQLSDWISNILLYEIEPNIFCCLTAHSVALKFEIRWHSEIELETADVNIIKKLPSLDQATLYSSFILGDTWDSTYIFGGTALGYVSIWHEKGDVLALLHRVNAHNGAVFSIDFDIEHNIMTTSSDDRSVRVWRLYFTKEIGLTYCRVKLLNTLYGHTARVFRCKIFKEKNVPFIISIGEDSNICVWSVLGSLMHRRHFNCVATLWNLDYDPTIKTVFISGSDGNVRELKLESIFDDRRLRTEVIPNEILVDGEYMSKLKLMDNENIVALTSHNRLIYQNNYGNWTVCLFDGYKSCVLEKFGRYVAIAGYQRASVFEYDSNSSLQLIFDVKNLQNMVRSFTFLNEDEYLLCDDSGNCTLTSRTCCSRTNFSLLTSKDSYVTVALKKKNFLLVGDRTGDLHLFEIEMNGVHHRHRLKRVHGNLGCTVLYSEKDKFVSSGHDGTTKEIFLNEISKTLTITLTKKLPVLWMERVIHCCDDKRLYAGFNDKHFAIANDDCDIVDERDCGGGHRFWDLLVNEYGGKLIFIRNKVLHSATLCCGYANDLEKYYDFPLLKWHIKSCNSLKLFELTKGMSIIVSAGDDNLLIFNRFKENTEAFMEPIGEIVQHISCIKTLTVIEVHPTERLVISGGGRAQICVTKIKTDGDAINIEEVTNFMLNSSDAERRKLGKSQEIDFDPETRFMSLVCTEDYQMFTGCSDGYLRQFYFNTVTSEITPVDSVLYGKCLLHVHYFRYEDRKYLLTMATDGHICFWSITSNNSIDSEPFYRLAHHDSGINSYDFVLVDDRFLIATGGDDQSTVITKFSLKEKTVEVIYTNRLHYHTAQINGVRFAKSGSLLYSIGPDQILYAVNLHTLVPLEICTTSIADTKGFQLLQNDRVIIYGSGIQLNNMRK